VMASPEQYRQGNTEWEELICFSFLLACNDVYDLISDMDSCTVLFYYTFIILFFILSFLYICISFLYILFLFTKYVLQTRTNYFLLLAFCCKSG
jgi:hypothetical protein